MVNPAIRRSAASARIPSRSAPSAKILTLRSSEHRVECLLARRGRIEPLPRRRGRRRARLRCRRAGRACGRCRDARPGRCGSPRRAPPRRRRRCRRSSTTRRGRCRARPPPRAASPARGLRQSHAPAELGDDPRGMVQAQTEAVEVHPLARRAARAPAPGPRAARSRLTSPLAAAGWLETPTRRQPAAREAPQRPRRRRATSATSSGLRAATPGRPLTGSGTSSLSDAVAVDEDRAARVVHGGRRRSATPSGPAARPELGMRDERVPDDRLEGLDQRRLQVRRRVDRRSRRRRARRACRPGPRRRRRCAAPRSRASSIALTRLIETLCSREPPPTQNTSSASRADSREIAEPLGERRLPAVVVGARGQLGDVVGRRVALDRGRACGSR